MERRFFSASEIEGFECDGFVIVRGLFDQDEVTRMSARYRRPVVRDGGRGRGGGREEPSRRR